MADDEVYHREFANDGIELRRDRIGPVTCVDKHNDAQLRTFLHGRPEPFQCPVGAITMHVGMQLQHFEAVFLDVEFQFRSPVLRAPARIEVEVTDEAVRIFLAKLGDIRHVIANAVAPAAVTIAITRIAGWRLNEAHIDPARLAVDHIRAVHELQHTLAGERFTGMTPGLVDQIGWMKMGVDDHVDSPLN